MKLIERGSPGAADWKAEFTCPGCKSRFEIDAADLTHSVSETEDTYHEYWMFKCPLCDHSHVVPNVPVIVQVELRKRLRK